MRFVRKRLSTHRRRSSSSPDVRRVVAPLLTSCTVSRRRRRPRWGSRELRVRGGGTPTPPPNRQHGRTSALTEHRTPNGEGISESRPTTEAATALERWEVDALATVTSRHFGDMRAVLLHAHYGTQQSHYFAGYEWIRHNSAPSLSGAWPAPSTRRYRTQPPAITGCS